MQDDFYGLHGNGFKLTPDVRLRFAHPSYTDALELISDAQQQGEGFVVLTGPPGIGKTTLIDELVARLSAQDITAARLSSTQVTAEELLRLITFAFGLSASDVTKAVLLDQLESHFRQQRPKGESAFLIIDEAQDLDTDALEELRLITNFTVESEPLVQVLLVGQERLWDMLVRPDLDLIHQRIIMSCQLQPLTATEARFYVAHRLSCVGWTGDPCISGKALSLIHDYALGVPRLINRVMNRLLAYGANAELHALERSHAEEVLQQLAFDHLRPRQNEAGAPGLDGLSETPPLAPLDATAFAAMATGQQSTMNAPQTPPRAQPRLRVNKDRNDVHTLPLNNTGSLPAMHNPSLVAGSELSSTEDSAGHQAFRPEQLEQVTKDLVVYLGPVASRLVKRTAKRARDLRQLYYLLAEHINDTKDRERFVEGK